MGRVFLCVSAACVQRRRSGRYSPIDRTGLSDCQREFIFPTISLYLSHSPYQSSYLGRPTSGCTLPLSIPLRALALSLSVLPYPSIHRDSLFPLFSTTVISPSPAHHNRSSPVYFPSLHCTSFVFSLSFSFSPPLYLLLPLSVTILSCAR